MDDGGDVHIYDNYRNNSFQKKWLRSLMIQSITYLESSKKMLIRKSMQSIIKKKLMPVLITLLILS